MKKFIDEYITNHISDFLREGYTPIDLAKWLFSTNHISTPYELKFEKVSIEKLSPGTRGVVLLLLFLKVDINDNRTILIDQPEDILDPASVYEKHIPYFREARELRQIIMVTHNPNLVVGTDSDQIIIAKSEKRDEDKLPIFNYISGGLENPELKTSVCNILEGGEAAFKRRQNRYLILKIENYILRTMSFLTGSFLESPILPCSLLFPSINKDRKRLFSSIFFHKDRSKFVFKWLFPV